MRFRSPTFGGVLRYTPHVSRTARLVLATLVVAGLLGCENDRASSTTLTSAAIAPDPGETKQRNEYARLAQGDMRNLDRRIQRLEAYARDLPDDAERLSLEDDLREARAHYRDLKLRVDAVATMPNATWKSEKPRLEADWQRVNERVDVVSAA